MDCTCYGGPLAPLCPLHRTLRDRCQRAVFEADVDDPLYPLGSPDDRYRIVDAVLAVVAAELTRSPE